MENSQLPDSDDFSYFIPKENLLETIMSMGISKNAALRGLFYTGNSNVDLAVSWIFENQNKDLDSNFDLRLELENKEDSDEMLMNTFHKMVFVVNPELKMGVGKIAAQVGHATLGVYKETLNLLPKYETMLRSWEEVGETKIVLRGTGSKNLLELHDKALSLSLPTYLVQDAGHTQIPAGSTTVLGIFGPVDIVDTITGDLSLL